MSYQFLSRSGLLDENLDIRTGTVWRKTALRMALLALMCIGLPTLLEISAYRETVAQARVDAREDLNRLRVEIERQVNRDVQLVRGLVSYVRVRPDLGQIEFERLASYLMSQDNNIIRNLALAKDLVISHVHPLEGNASVLGVAYIDLKDQYPMVKKTVDENRIFIAGPINLIQGGTGIIARFPVYRSTTETIAPELWGIASMVIDFNLLLQKVRFTHFSQRYDLALYHVESGVVSDQPFLGDASTLGSDPVALDIALVGTSWSISATPKGGWPKHSNRFWQTVIVAIIALVIGSYLIIVGMRFENALIRLAVQLETAKREADAARSIAESANRAKTQFLANMSHELRTPLNAIIGFSQIMIGGLLGRINNSKYEEYLKDILASSQHLLDVIGDILDITRVEAGEMELHEQVFSVRALVDASLRLTRARADQKGQTIEVAVPEDLPPISADNRMLRQALMNLLSNSIKFTPDGGRITITAGLTEAGELELSVQDTGKGIAPEDLDRILEPFAQGRASSEIAYEGTGLGLSISKRMLDAPGGNLRIESELGKWTRVTLTIPADRVNPPGSD
ncbi:MAG: ATP-binding protein [Alphaproteobacteria bacterium]|nr:ATP-binding protein [Alphaproteobacteria bacterium]